MGDAGAAGTLPAGTVTFLFTDLEGSTGPQQAHPAAYREAVRRHHDLLRGAVEAHGGMVFETVGDAVYAAFHRPTDAVAAALAGQLALGREAWGATGPLRARMGVHLGEAEAYPAPGAAHGARYFGLPLVRCARLMATAHGGQTVLSAAVAEVVRDALPAGAALRDLGAHRLKDLARPERVAQLLHPGLPADFPPLRSLDALPHNLPRQGAPFIGREAELAAVVERLRRTDVPLLTLTGPGGTGKTRLALQAAAEALDSAGPFPDGVWFVDLAPLADPALVPAAVAQALGVQEAAGRPLAEALRDYLRERRLLLVLDNCEHLLPGAAPEAAALLAAGSGVTVLATSREALRVAGEREHPVPPLGLPPLPGPSGPPGTSAAPPPDPAALSQYEAVALFVERAVAAKPGFAVTNATAPAVAELCHRLDGLPLAIELAAARVKVLSPPALLARLGDRLGVLTGGRRDAPARQQTLRAAIAWSYDLLAPAEQALFARLAVFAGGWTLEAAEAGVGGAPAAGAEPPVDGLDVLEGLASLVDKSLVRQAEAEGPEAEPRFAMLETVREFARERLAAGGEAAALRRAHAAYYLALAEQAAPELEGPRQLTWLGRLEAEHENLRQALRWSQESGQAAPGLRLAAALWPFWRSRGRHREGRAWLEAALALPGAAARTPARAAALCVAGSLAGALGDGAAARARLEASVALWRELGDARGLGRALAQLGFATTPRDAAAARALVEEAVALARAAGDRSGLAYALRILGNVEAPRRAAPAGPAPLEESAALFRELGDAWGLSRALTGLGARALGEGDLPAARAYLEEALARRREADDQIGVAWVLNNLGALALRQGEPRRAAELLEEGRALAQDLGYTSTATVAHALAELGHTALAVGDAPRAAALLKESLRLSRAHGTVWLRWRALAGLAACAARAGRRGAPCAWAPRPWPWPRAATGLSAQPTGPRSRAASPPPGRRSPPRRRRRPGPRGRRCRSRRPPPTRWKNLGRSPPTNATVDPKCSVRGVRGPGRAADHSWSGRAPRRRGVACTVASGAGAVSSCVRSSPSGGVGPPAACLTGGAAARPAAASHSVLASSSAAPAVWTALARRKPTTANSGPPTASPIPAPRGRAAVRATATPERTRPAVNSSRPGRAVATRAGP